jgi:MerR family transcriptional regulator, copper efflux regulator
MLQGQDEEGGGMRIGELGSLTGVKETTIRFYEQRGLLPPPIRTGSGYRDYDGSSRGRLAFIRAGQAVGLTLAEIREILDFRDQGVAPCTHVTKLIDTREQQITRQIEDLQDLRLELRRLSERASRLDPAACSPDDVCHVIPRGSANSTRVREH